MVYDVLASDNQRDTCAVCDNQLGHASKGKRYCPFCRTPLGLSVAELPTLDDIVGFQVVGKVALKGPGVVYEAVHDGARLLVTLLEEDGNWYPTLSSYRDRGETDPFRVSGMSAHPNLVRTHPVIWRGKVAVATADFMDGKKLGEWLHAVGPIDVADAVGIVLKCLQVVRHLGDAGLNERVHPNVIQICTDGEVKITCFTDVLLMCFADSVLSVSSMMRNDLDNLKKLTQFSAVGCLAPEFNSETQLAAKYSADQLRVQQIYSLGGLLYELLADHQLPSISSGQHLIKSFQLVPIHELRSEAPTELSAIVAKMTAYSPSDRYQDYDQPIADLESLNLASERVSFIDRQGPPENKAETAAKAKRQWVHRESDCDFRRIKWGMTTDEVWQAENDVVSRAMPTAIFVETEYQGTKLQLIYLFAQDGDQVVCVGATLSPENLIYKPGDIQKFYDQLKELVTADYGAPDVEDGPLLEDLEMAEFIAQTEGVRPAQVLQNCKTTTWSNVNTQVWLSVRPSIGGRRMVTATFQVDPTK